MTDVDGEPGYPAWVGALYELNGATGGLQARAVDEIDWQQAVKILDGLRDVVEALRVIDANLVRHIYLTGEHGDQTVAGVGHVSITRGRDRKRWDERGVAQAVLDAHMTEREGVMPNDPWEIVEWLFEVVSVGYARVRPLRALGLDPDEFCDSTPGPLSVRLPPRT